MLNIHIDFNKTCLEQICKLRFSDSVKVQLKSYTTEKIGNKKKHRRWNEGMIMNTVSI